MGTAQPSDRMPEWLAQRARLSPERTALVCGDETWSFAELDRRASVLAAGLRDRGVAPGDLVAVLAGNGSAFVRAMHAVPRAGAVLVPLNVRLTLEELSWQIAHCGAASLLYDDSQAETAEQLASAQSALQATAIADMANSESKLRDSAQEHVDLSRLHSVIYTSGTSGRPKGAMLTHGNHLWSAIGSALKLGLLPDDRWLACMPLFHVGGLSILLRSVICGITTTVHEAFDPDRVNHAIDNDGVTVISLVPTMLQRMLDARGEKPYPETLRCLLVGGGPLSAALHDDCVRRTLPIAPTYGLTEAASQVATKAPWETAAPGSTGRPLFPTEVRVVNEDGSMAPEDTGEIIVCGPTVTPGYLDDPEATAAALRDGWLHTGDVGRLDAGGDLHVLDRRDNLIVTGGENVYPAEVEEALCAHPAVEDAGVVGLADAEWGQTVVAAVVLRPGGEARPEALRQFCRGKLAGYKVPERIRIVEELPRTPSGKLLRRKLREQLGAG